MSSLSKIQEIIDGRFDKSIDISNKPIEYIAASLFFYQNVIVKINDENWTMDIIEYLVEKGEDFIYDVLEALTIKNIKHLKLDLTIILDFFTLLKHASDYELHDCSDYLWLEIFDGKIKIRGADHITSKRAMLFFALTDKNIRGDFYMPILDKTISILDIVRLSFYNGDDLWQDISFNNCINHRGRLRHQSIEKYIRYYHLPFDRDNIIKYLLEHTIFVTTNIIIEYLFGISLDERAKKVGMIFPSQIKNEAEKYTYFFDNIQHYNDSRRLIYTENKSFISHLTDKELLILYKGEWKDRKDLEWKVKKLNKK